MDIVERLNGHATGYEEWRAVPEFPNYLVSRSGQVLSLRRPRAAGGILSSKIASGYVVVRLQRGKSRFTALVHRLVLSAFIGPCPDFMEAAHLDGNRLNNSLENLKWVTRKENHSHKSMHGTRQSGEKAPSAKLSWESVRYIRSQYRKIRQTDLAERFGVNRTTIQRIHSGECWSE